MQAGDINRSDIQSNNLVEMWKMSKRRYKKEGKIRGKGRYIRKLSQWTKWHNATKTRPRKWRRGKVPDFCWNIDRFLTCIGRILGSTLIPIASVFGEVNIRMPRSSAELASCISVFQNFTRFLLLKVWSVDQKQYYWDLLKNTESHVLPQAYWTESEF